MSEPKEVSIYFRTSLLTLRGGDVKHLHHHPPGHHNLALSNQHHRTSAKNRNGTHEVCATALIREADLTERLC